MLSSLLLVATVLNVRPLPTDLHQVLQVPTDLQVASTAHTDPTSTDLQVYSYRYALLVLSSCRSHLMDKKTSGDSGQKTWSSRRSQSNLRVPIRSQF